MGADLDPLLTLLTLLSAVLPTSCSTPAGAAGGSGSTLKPPDQPEARSSRSMKNSPEVALAFPNTHVIVAAEGCPPTVCKAVAVLGQHSLVRWVDH
jgi:hypothetical protein